MEEALKDSKLALLMPSKSKLHTKKFLTIVLIVVVISISIILGIVYGVYAKTITGSYEKSNLKNGKNSPKSVRKSKTVHNTVAISTEESSSIQTPNSIYSMSIEPDISSTEASTISSTTTMTTFTTKTTSTMSYPYSLKSVHKSKTVQNTVAISTEESSSIQTPNSIYSMSIEPDISSTEASTISSTTTMTTFTTKTTSTMSNPSPSVFCPLKKDLVAIWGGAETVDRGWTITGMGGVGSLSTYNLLGGSIEYDIDFTNVNSGVNANIYSVSYFIPPTGYNPRNSTYTCDGSQNQKDKWCVEIDWIESNGGCGGSTSMHTTINQGSSRSFYFNGQKSVHMKVSYSPTGLMTVNYGALTFNSSSFVDNPTDSDYNALVSYYTTKGALLQSSQWVGWVPLPDCGPNGDATGSVYRIRNLTITGTVVQGPTPNLC